MSEAIDRAVDALAAGESVIYPTETVYGLGADALNADAVAAVFAIKGRDRDKPISMALSSSDVLAEYTHPTARERAFVEAFLPGPITVVLAAKPLVPDVLTGGRERVGIRIPDHPTARRLASEFGPITATSANRSGTPSARQVTDIDENLREAVGAVIDEGETPGGGSTVVDVEAGTIHRRGQMAHAVEAWLAEH